jgi:signal transduction histidine kinase
MIDKNYEEEYRKKLEEVARFPDMNPGPVLRLDFNGCILLSNAAAQNLFGQDLHGKNWKSICKSITDADWKKIIITSEVYPVEATVGEKCFVFNHRTDLNSQLVFVFGSDITVNKLNERKLEEQKAVIEEIARFPHMNPGPVIRMNFDGTILLSNRAAQQLFGEDITGKNWRHKCPDITDAMWKKFTTTEEVHPIEAQFGQQVFMFNHRADLHSGLVFVFGTDITLQRLAERQLHQHEKMATLGTLAAGIAHELNNPAAAASSAAIQLKTLMGESEAWRNKMIRTVMNENDQALIDELHARAKEAALHLTKLSVREFSEREYDIEDWMSEQQIENVLRYAAPIASLGYTIDEIKNLASSHDKDFFFSTIIWAAHQYQVSSMLNELEESSRRISEIVKAMRSYSYLDKAAVQELNIHEGIDNTLIILRSKITRGIIIKREFGDLPTITAFGSELNQVWTNILDNAISALKEKGTIIIRTKTDQENVTVEIEDDGPGIPKEIQNRIFDPFFTTKGPGKGTGLGLATSYGIITEKHQGTIRLQSQPGKTVFIVTIPIKRIGD